MNGNDQNTFSLLRAQQEIIAAIHRLPSEIVHLDEALLRITSADVSAVIPQPSFDESTRDGFVIGGIDGSEQKINRYHVVHEIPAGSKPSGEILRPGTACRVMTGGCVPEGSTRVVPYEKCVEENGAVSIADSPLQATTFIRRTGSEIARGELLVGRGVALQAGHLALLASCGVHAVPVIARPSVGYACTGNELNSGADALENGQKVSSNAFLLGGLLTSVGAQPLHMGIVRDNAQDLRNFFAKILVDKQFDAIITTGGMGPGKYDLVQKAFVEAGGKVIFHALAMRPGKSFLFGTLGQTLCFGLPGPPPAVRTLLNQLVGPALLAMQGRQGGWPKKVQAYLQHQINIKRNDVLQLKDGSLTVAAGRCSARFTERLEMGNCFIALPPGQTHHAEGDLVEVYLALDQWVGWSEG